MTNSQILTVIGMYGVFALSVAAGLLYEKYRR